MQCFGEFYVTKNDEHTVEGDDNSVRKEEFRYFCFRPFRHYAF